MMGMERTRLRPAITPYLSEINHLEFPKPRQQKRDHAQIT